MHRSLRRTQRLERAVPTESLRLSDGNGGCCRMSAVRIQPRERCILSESLRCGNGYSEIGRVIVIRIVATIVDRSLAKRRRNLD